MAKLLIKNITATPIALPPPLAGILAGGGSTVLDLPGSPTPAQVIELLSTAFAAGEVIAFEEVADGNPEGPFSIPGSADLYSIAISNITGPLSVNNQRINAVAAPVDPSDAATKQYVDTYVPGVSADWAGDPATLQEALDRLAAAVAGLLGAPIP